MEIWIAIGVIALVLILMFNSLIAKRNKVNEAFSGVDVQLKKRHDLIPNLVATVKKYSQHEKDLLENVTKLRAQYQEETNNQKKVALENEMSGLIGKIMVAVEAYPDLKANENFMQLQRSLNEIEEQLSAARRTFNAAVLDLNNAVEMFPTNLVAKLMSLKTQTMFVVQDVERSRPEVQQLFNA